MKRKNTLLSVVLICHENDAIDCQIIAAWLACNFSLAGIVFLKDRPGSMLIKLRREYRRVGFWRLLDVVVFRLFYKLRHARSDARWVKQQVRDMQCHYPADLDAIPSLQAYNPNTREVRDFIAQLSPDFALARCKYILKPDIFTIPRLGTFVLHPGICPRYRNAHGCFWALANRDLENVGMTLIQVDSGVDTGPVYLRSSYRFDEFRESHVVIQHRVVLENLDEITRTFYALGNNTARPESVQSTISKTWGQPWMSAYLHWKHCLTQGIV